MQDMQQVSHLILEYTLVLLNITLAQTQTCIMTKYLGFVMKQTFRRQCCASNIFTFKKKNQNQMNRCHTRTQESRRYSSISLTMNRHLKKASCSSQYR